MFGSFAFALSSVLAISSAQAQTSAKTPNQPPVKTAAASPRGTVLNDGAIVYKAPNFDAPVLGYLKAGNSYPISSRLYEGAFYKILVKKGLMGFVADTDISTDQKTVKAMKDQRAKEQKEFEMEEDSLRRKPFAEVQFGGLGYRQLNYRERTMGGMKKGTVPMIGMSLFGPGLIGNESQLNVLMSSGAPEYYKQKTGNPTSGFLMIMDFTFETVFPQSPAVVTHIGFGPMLRYNKYNVQIGSTPYSLEDAAIGVVIGTGGAIRIGKVAIRGEIKYHHEASQYLGFQGSLQYGF